MPGDRLPRVGFDGPRRSLFSVRKKGPDSSGFQLTGFYGDYHWSRVCFESKQVCFGTIAAGWKDVTEGYESDNVPFQEVFSPGSYHHICHIAGIVACTLELWICFSVRIHVSTCLIHLLYCENKD